MITNLDQIVVGAEILWLSCGKTFRYTITKIDERTVPIYIHLQSKVTGELLDKKDISVIN